jgi:hypothetical protein
MVSIPFCPPPATSSPLAFPFGDFGTCTFPTTPARYARALALALARWCAAGQGARKARGEGRVAGRPEVPEGGKAGGLPTRLSGNPGRVPGPSRDGAPPAKPAGSPRD